MDSVDYGVTPFLDGWPIIHAIQLALKIRGFVFSPEADGYCNMKNFEVEQLVRRAGPSWTVSALMSAYVRILVYIFCVVGCHLSYGIYPAGTDTRCWENPLWWVHFYLTGFGPLSFWFLICV